MTLTVRVDDEDAQMIKAYAKQRGLSVSQLVRAAVLEQIEDEYDRQAYKEALAEFQKNPITYTLDEVAEHIGLC